MAWLPNGDMHWFELGSWFFMAWDQGLWEYGHIKEWHDEFGTHRELTSLGTSWEPVLAWEIM